MIRGAALIAGPILFAALFFQLQAPGGDSAMQLRIAEQYIREFGNLAKQGNTFVVPSNLSDIASIIALATGVGKGNGSAAAR